MSDILETIITRRSVKSFKDCEVESEQIEKVLKAVMYAQLTSFTPTLKLSVINTIL